MPEQPTKEWTPRWDGRAPPDWDGVRETVQMWCNGGWTRCGPDWLMDVTYRYTPIADAPCPHALKAATDMLGRESPTIVVARLIEKHEPELLVDPLVELLTEAHEAARWGPHYWTDIAAALRKNPDALRAAVEGGCDGR